MLVKLADFASYLFYLIFNFCHLHCHSNWHFDQSFVFVCSWHCSNTITINIIIMVSIIIISTLSSSLTLCKLAKVGMKPKARLQRKQKQSFASKGDNLPLSNLRQIYFAIWDKYILQFETNMYNEAKKSKVSTEAAARLCIKRR